MLHNRRSRRRGQALIETAFIIIALLALTIGLIQYGLIYYTQLSLTNLTRDASRYAAIHGSETDVASKVQKYVRDKATQNGGLFTGDDFPDPNISVSPAPGAAGQRITVKIQYDMRKKIFIKSMPGTNRAGWNNYTTTMAMTIE